MRESQVPIKDSRNLWCSRNPGRSPGQSLAAFADFAGDALVLLRSFYGDSKITVSKSVTHVITVTHVDAICAQLLRNFLCISVRKLEQDEISVRTKHANARNRAERPYKIFAQ